MKRNGITASYHENASDLHLLSYAEQRLCNDVRIKPKPYLCIKDRLIQEAIKHRGVLTENTARDLCKVRTRTSTSIEDGTYEGNLKIEAAKVSKIHEFFAKSGWIAKA